MKTCIRKRISLILVALLVITVTFTLAACPKEKQIFMVDFVVDNIVYDTVETTEGDLTVLSKSEPTKKGYIFDGWYTEAGHLTKWSLESDKAASDMSLYAKWERAEYTITYHNIEGISNPNPTGFNIDSKISLQNVEKENHTFMGWYSDAQLTQKITEISKGTTGNLDIYADLLGDFESGTGTETDPFVIATKHNLEKFRAKVETVDDSVELYFKLSADIDLGGAEWRPIYKFYGVLDGCGFEVGNFKITSLANRFVGLFGHCQGTIKNLGVVDFTINVTLIGNSTSAEVVAGGLVGGTENAIITNCYAEGSITAKSTGMGGYAGGLVGDKYVRYYDYGIIENCYANVDVNISTTLSGQVSGGGLVGRSDGGEIKNCYATGAVTAKSFIAMAGGLVGSCYTELTSCFATGAVAATTGTGGVGAGGLVGSNSELITNCYATGSVTATKNAISTAYDINVIMVGGLAGDSRGIIKNCYATNNVAINSSAEPLDMEVYSGGFVGKSEGDIENCYSTGRQALNLDKLEGLEGNDLLIYAIMLLQSGKYNTGNFVGFSYPTQLTNNYYYSESGGSSKDGITVCAASDLEDADFYTNTLLWSGFDWNFIGTLSPSSGPKLRGIAY